MSAMRLSLVNRLLILIGLLTISTVVIAESYFQRHERTSLEMRMREKANFINNFYAFLISDALQHDDDITLLQVVNRLEQDPEIVSVIVVDDKASVRYHVDPEKVGTTMNDPLLQKALETGEGLANNTQDAGGQALVLISPLKVRGQSTPLGAIRIEFTYRHIDDQVHAGSASFEIMAYGCLSLCVGGMFTGFKRWIIEPIRRLQFTTQNINPLAPEPNFAESDDDFGQLGKSWNDLLSRLKAELQARQAAATAARNELPLLEPSLRALIPDGRIILTDKNNLVISDSADTLESSVMGQHLLDLITDSNFSTLVGAAYQQEGVPARGSVTTDGKQWDATVLKLGEAQSKLVQTIIVLRASTVPH